MHWVAAEHSLPVEVRLYDHLFKVEDPSIGELEDILNPDSLEVLTESRVELNLKDAKPGDKFQFERQGYFCVDPDSTPDRLVFNRTAALRDTWSKVKGN